MTSENQRKHRRFQSLNLLYLCLDEGGNIVRQGMGRTLNISESGILLETHFPIEPDHTVQVTLGLDEDLVEISGKPIHFSAKKGGKYEIGIQFFELDQNVSRTLKEFINASGFQPKEGGEKNE